MSTHNLDKGIVEELKQLMENVPFGSSSFQIEKFVASEETPERTYRKVLLQINSKLKALEECKYKRDLLQIDLEELKSKLETEQNKFEARRHKLNIDRKESQLIDEMKLINDAIYELVAYKKIVDRLPKFTREQFELSENKYWETKLLSDAQSEVIADGRVSKGTIESLKKIDIGIGRDDQGKLFFSMNEQKLLDKGNA